MRPTTALAALLAGALLVPASAPDARACGGCFHPPPLPTETGTVVTDHQMIFVVSPAQTTLYDMIQYSGSPSSFAWVLPIHGTVTVGLSSDTVFAALDQVTKSTFVPPVLPPCPVPANCSACDFAGAASGGGSSGTASSSGSSSGGPPPVTVLSQATVGPYDTVQLQSTDPNALTNWLTTNGYNIPADVQPIIAAYVADGFDFLALRLSPGQGVQAMRPVSVTTPGAGMTLPLRMVAAGTGATVGVTLWVLSAGRYEPANFASFTIAPSELVWDWGTYMSNYTTLDQQKEQSMLNAAWLVESSEDVAPYSVEDLVLGTGGFFGGSSGGTVVNPTTEGYTGSDAGDAAATAQQERSKDLQTLFPAGAGNVRITRLRADLSHAALANDLVLRASADQSTLSSQYTITQSVNAPVCPNPPVCPCGGPGGSVGSSGAGTSGGTGGTGGGGGGAAPLTTASGKSGSTSGCSASASEPGGNGVEFLVVGIAGAMVYGSRRRRSRR